MADKKNIMEHFAQRVAQQEDSGIYSATYDALAVGKEDKASDKFLDDIANNTPNSDQFKDRTPKKKLTEQVININNYERYWDNSTPTGHQIRIICQDDSTLTLNLNWPRGYNPRLHDIDERATYGGTKTKSQRLKKKSKSTGGSKKER